MNKHAPHSLRTLGGRSLFSILFCIYFGAVVGLAQDTKKAPSSKLYIAEVIGEPQIDTGKRIETLTKKSVFSAEGTTLVTKGTSSGTLVLSNGTGLSLSPETRIKVNAFVQEPFTPNRTDMDVEPSISVSHVTLSRGSIALCTSKLVAGSSMLYETSQALISVRGAKISINADDEETRIAVLDGEITVRGGPHDLAGHVIVGGQMATIRRGQQGQANPVTVMAIPSSSKPLLDEQVSAACMAKRTVYFDVRDGGSEENATDGGPKGASGLGQMIVPVEVVGGDIRTGSEISPARL